ncbi:MAG TPA: hypothetical protein VJ934_01760 [Desulfomicrobiaceae bacterium]|nr:hypothetical protein [Desulfomicrobiaceae bacterium]
MKSRLIGCLWLTAVLMLAACGNSSHEETSPSVPRGYYDRIEIIHQGRTLSFGPFVGYYFKPVRADDLTRLQVICFNERGFYTDDLPVNARLFQGEAVLTTLPEVSAIPRSKNRITPIFFDNAPEAWLTSRPSPKEEFVHFHSAYTGTGAVFTGYWIRHQAVSEFTYDMGGRIRKESPLYHRAGPGTEGAFPHIIEFDRGPEKN